MGIIHDIVSEGGVAFVGKIGDPQIEALLEACSERCSAEAADRNIYLCDALDNLDRHRDFEPDPDEVRELLSDADLGDWRRVVTAAAHVAVREYLGRQVEHDVDTLKAAIAEATSQGYVAVALHAVCPFGWAPHQDETCWRTGKLFVWKRLEGDMLVSALSVAVSGADLIWIQLARAG